MVYNEHEKNIPSSDMEENKETNEKAITQESLQPQRIEKGTKPYLSVLDLEERIQKKDAYNIALTGPYGSGKSSILVTLKEDYPDHHYLNISLATLRPLQEKNSEENHNIEPDGNIKEESDDTVEEPKEIDKKEEKPTKQNIDRLIEYSILQQLIYREKQETLPNSRFKRIYQQPAKRIRRITISIILAVLAIIVVFEPTFVRVEWLCQLLGKTWLNIAGDILGIGYLSWFAYKAFYMIVPAVSNSRLNKVNLKDGEIEIVKNTSIFNKHLDEILYFFEQTDYDVVLLEDLDRFESTDIFLKLRELNLLLNESKVINRKIVFIYAVRDDMFQDEGRVKCFDYITTVIPVINPSNAKSKLKEELEKRGVDEIKEYHLRELGFFLHDMRLLKNIANEYVQYRGKLSKGISCEKLLGMIVYKNYYPQDFSDLHDGKGIVYQLLNLKEYFVAARVKELEDDNKRKQDQRITYQQERHLKEKELRRIYVEAYRDKVGNNALSLKAGDGMYGFSEIAADEKLFEKLISDPTVTYSYNTYVNYAVRTQQKAVNMPFSVIEGTVNESLSYQDRLDALRQGFSSLEDEIIVGIRKEDIRSQTLSQIMGDLDYSSFKEYKDLNVPPMIEFLVAHGYVDENYYDYISYFYGNFIDSHDWDFVLDLKLFKAHPYDFHINSVKACLEEIPSIVYRRIAILNIDLLNYLATHVSEKENQKRIRVILRTAIENKKYDFLADYYQKGNQQDVVFSQLFGQHKNLWSVFEKNDDEKQSLRLCWYKYAEKEQSCEGSKKWLNSHFSFITDHLLDIEDEQWCILIKEGEYEFGELNGTSTNILKAVVEKNAYSLTRHNLETLVSCLLDMNLDSVSYRLVCETENDMLIGRVEENLGQCLKTVFASPESEKESEDTVIGILLSTQVTEEEKIEYLKKQQNIIKLDAIEQKSDKTLALKCDVISATWENVIHYMNNVSEQKSDDVLTAFIEKHADELAGIAVPQESEDDERMLLRQFIKSDVLSFEAYSKILNQFTRWTFTGVPSVEERRVQLLISKNTIRFKEENTTDMLNNYSGTAVVSYLMKNKRDYLSNPETVAYTTEIAVRLMKSSLSIREKAIIIPCFEESILNKELANEVIGVLKVQEINLDVEFLMNVMSLSDKTDDKVVVLAYTLEKNTFDEVTITSFINTLPGKYKEIAEKGKKPEIPKNDGSNRLVRILDERKYISSYSETKNGIRVNTKLK